MLDFAVLPPGLVFAGRYVIVRMIKAGGMGAVYEAQHRETKRRVALKTMRPEIVGEAEERARFVREAQVATLIESSHVVDVLDAGVDEQTGVPFLVMEFLVGEELGDRLARLGRLPPQEVVSMLAQAARALDKAHARGVIHRDLKPENLFLVMRDGETPSLKILDFGIAKLVQQNSSHAGMTGTRATGTPLYMAPEQTRKSSSIGATTDVWALGLVAFTLIVGRTYWEADDINQLLGEILVHPLESPIARAARVGVALPPTFDAWFFGCVQRDPAHRYPRAGDAIAGLGAVFGIDARPSIPSAPTPVSAVGPTAVGTQAYAGLAPLIATTAAPVTDRLAPPPPLPPTHRATGSGKTLPIAIVVAGLVIAGGLAVGLSMRGEESASNDQGAHTTTPHAKPAPSHTTPASDDDEDPAQTAKPLAEVLAASNPWVAVGTVRAQKHEVTRAEYAAFLGSLKGDARAEATPIQAWTAASSTGLTKKLPVTWVTWEQATKFCVAAEGRLPTSDEWSHLLGTKYPWGDTWPTSLAGIAIGQGDSADPIAVGASDADKSTAGLVDLAGNAQEWTSTVVDGLATVRGASIVMNAEDAKSAITDGVQKFTAAGAGAEAKPESIASAHVGIRCVRSRGNG